MVSTWTERERMGGRQQVERDGDGERIETLRLRDGNVAVSRRRVSPCGLCLQPSSVSVCGILFVSS